MFLHGGNGADRRVGSMVVKRGCLLWKIRKKGVFAMRSAVGVGSSPWMLLPELPR